MISLKNLLLIFASICFICVLGGGLYEHVATVPKWAAAPPSSLSMFNGSYGVNAGPFWMSIHPVTLLLMISALVANWKTGRRRGIMTVLIAYFAILVITFVYFVPELISIITTPYRDTVDAALQSRAARWEKLSIARLIIVVFLSGVLLSCLTKPAFQTNSSIQK